MSSRGSAKTSVLTRRGRVVAVVAEREECERLAFRARFVAAVEAGARAASVEDLHSNREAMKILDSFGE